MVTDAAICHLRVNLQRQLIDTQQGDGGDDAHGNAGDERDEAGGLPPKGEIDAGQRGMRVAESGVGDQRSGAKEIIRCRNVVAGFVPVVGQAQQRRMSEVDADENEGEDLPQVEGPQLPHGC